MWQGLARSRAEAVEMLSPLGTGTARRQLRDVGGVGKPTPRAGSWLWRAARGIGKARQLADLCGEARQGPLHLIHGGDLVLILPDTDALARTGTLASIPMPTAGILGHPSARTVPKPSRPRCPQAPARGHISLSCPRRSRRAATLRHGSRSDGPGFLAVAHVPEHPLVTARGAEVAVHPVALARSEART